MLTLRNIQCVFVSVFEFSFDRAFGNVKVFENILHQMSAEDPAGTGDDFNRIKDHRYDFRMILKSEFQMVEKIKEK